MAHSYTEEPEPVGAALPTVGPFEARDLAGVLHHMPGKEQPRPLRQLLLAVRLHLARSQRRAAVAT